MKASTAEFGFTETQDVTQPEGEEILIIRVTKLRAFEERKH